MVFVLGLTGCQGELTGPASHRACEDPSGVVFEVTASFDVVQAPLGSADRLEGCVQVSAGAWEARTGRLESILGYRFRLGVEAWEGGADDLTTQFTGQLRGLDGPAFDVTEDGSSMSALHLYTFTRSTPNRWTLSIETPTGGEPRVVIRERAFLADVIGEGRVVIARR